MVISEKKESFMKKILCIGIMLMVPVNVLFAEPSGNRTTSETGVAEYTLKDLYRLAMQRAEKIKISSEDVYRAEREKDKSFSEFLPELSAFGNYTRYSKKRESSEGFQLQPDSSADWGLRLDYSLSLGGREFTSFEMAKENVLKSRFEFDTVKEEYLFVVSSSYYDVLKAKKALEIARQNVERLTKHRDAAQTRLKVGEATKTVLLRAEAELSGARSEEIRTANILKLAKAILARTVGIEGNYDIQEGEAVIELYRKDALNFLIESCRQRC
jgi:outer membrane protein